MPDVLILIPARMASTRLPGKPLADIAGEPMIVHVWRRALEANVGPVWVATDLPAVAAAVEKAGGRATITRGDHASGTDRIHEALREADPARRADIVVNVQGDLPTLKPADLAAAAALSSTARSILPRWPPRSSKRTSAAIRTWSRWLVSSRSGPAACRFISRARARRPARGRSIITSASMPSAAPLWSGLSRCRPRPWSGASALSSCGHWKPACASMRRSSPACRWVSTRRRIWKRRAPC